MSNKTHAICKPVSPYFDLVRGALGSLVDGEHFFDCMADDIVYEVSTTSLDGFCMPMSGVIVLSSWPVRLLLTGRNNAPSVSAA